MRILRPGKRGLALLAAGLALGCGDAGGATFAPLALDPAAPPALGHFLERLAPEAGEGAPPWSGIRARSASDWSAGYRVIEVAPHDAPGPPLAATLFAGSPTGDTRWHFRCEAGREAALLWWLFSGEGAVPASALALVAGGTRFPLVLPREPARLVAYRLPAGAGFCRGADRDAEVSLVAEELPSGLLMGEPLLLVASAEPPPPAILISLDTLRADYWEHDRPRPPELEAFARESVRYARAWTAAPSTWPAHSVMLSGLYLDEIERRRIWELPTIAGDFRARGYATQAFVAGGYVRARFGYPVSAGAARARPRAPGFALGFDLYLEGSHNPADVRRARTLTRDPLEREARLESVRYSLAGALERSLRSWRAAPGVPAFHFVHGYDVHEYRGVARRYWDAVRSDHLAAEQDGAELQRCLDASGVASDARVVTLPEDWQPAPGCRPLLLSLLYEARVRSVEDALARYLAELRALGVYDRAAIAITSDHGEGLLDEADHWGHNRLLSNNLRVPLWLKPPGGQGGGREERLVGLVELRALLARATGGADPEPGGGARAPLRFADRWSSGLVLADGSLCRWSPPGPTLEVFLAGRWRAPGGAQATRCERADVTARSGSQRVLEPGVPPELEEELRALGYAE